MQRGLTAIIVLVALFAAAGYFLFPFQLKLPAGPTGPSENMTAEVVAENLEVPWALDFAQDGRLFFTERSGRVSVIENRTVKRIATINATQVGESGLHGIALLGDYVYIYYTYDRNGTLANRVSRLKESAPKSEEVILDNIPGASLHDGGRIKFGPDGKLYITTGDATLREQAQNLSSLAGKILRLNPNGSIPSDNPFPNSPVFSYGHRNPQGLAWDANGRLYATEHGPSANDEVNMILPGKNYGWPRYECAANAAGFEDPLVCFRDFTLAPAGIAVRSSGSQTELYVAGLRGQQIRRIVINGTAIVLNYLWLESYGRIRDALIGPDGALYFSTSNRDGRGSPAADDDKILRIRVS